jgi:2-oxoglutarate dehydrogenase E2 component (dihydrolipoamide succinyltransferase)
VDITMPQLGETVTEGTVTRWLKQVGEQVAPDELIFEVSTDKVDSEVPSPGGGFLSEILVPEGETVPVGTRLAVLTDSPPGEASGGDGAQATAEAPAQSAPAEAQASQAAETAEAAPAETEAPQAAETAESAPAEAEAPQAAETAEAAAPVPEAAEAGGDTAPGSEADEPAGARAEADLAKRQSEEQPPAEAAPAAEAPPAPAPEPEAEATAAGNGNGGAAGMLLSPVVRRLISEHDLDPADIPGTGEGGRITRSDVLAYIDKRSGGGRPAEAPAEAPAAKAPAAEAPAAEAPAAEAPAAEAPAAEAPAKAPAPAATRTAGDEVIPFDNIRRRTAEHMVRSKATSPHVLTAVEVDFDAVEQARAAAKGDWKAKEGFSLTYLPFIARAVCDALSEFPRLNASVDGDSLVVHGSVNLGIAVDMGEKGLIVPVVKAAEGKRLRQIAREVRDLAERARTKKLAPDDVAGGTFTITNPGPFGTLISAPVINQPQVAILSTDGVRKRPVVVETPSGDAIAIHPVGILAMSWDHRANDGAYTAAFLNRLREILETRDWDTELV